MQLIGICFNLKHGVAKFLGEIVSCFKVLLQTEAEAELCSLKFISLC